ncbi:MAG TPA: hypothetical protein PKA90_11025 [Ignavibacteria bacterium]|nr:hypothetical protein [Ignavibacteria bacterium]HMR40950.1 hypothetical protein [Ignavibacteria bacterium]
MKIRVTLYAGVRCDPGIPVVLLFKSFTPLSGDKCRVDIYY